MLRIVATLCIAVLIASLHGMSQDGVSPSPPLTAANRPFSPGVKLGGTVYLSGHLGIDPATGKPSSDVSEEARQVMLSVQTTLQEGGMSMDDLVYVEVYCTDLSLYGAFNKEYVSLFHRPYPARGFIGVKDLLFGAHFEVMGIAVRHAAHNKKLLSKTR